MNSREIVLANINHNNPPRPGLDFNRGRFSDFLFAELQPYGFQPKIRIEGEREYYTDEWGNLWHRMVSGSLKGEIYQPFIKDWSDLSRLQPPDYSHSDCAAAMRSAFLHAGDKFKLAYIGGWIFDNARYLRDMASYFYDMAANPVEVQQLHDIIAVVYEQKIHLAGQAQG